MALEIEFTSPNEKPALLGLTTPSFLAAIRPQVKEAGYKNHESQDASDFLTRYSLTQYPLVVIEELFSAPTTEENFALRALQRLPMMQRRHSVIILVGDTFDTLSSLQAFQQSVHAVVHPKDLGSLSDVIRQTVAEMNSLLTCYRETQNRIAQGKI